MFGWIISVVTGIWDVFQGVADATIVFILSVLSTIGNGLKAVGVALWQVGTDVWGFTRAAWDSVLKPIIDDVAKAVWNSLKVVYEDVLKPAWTKFNKLVTRLHTWLQTKFAPILKWLVKARAFIQHIYDQVVRPILDILDVAKQGLGLLAQLGVAWAKQLENDLSALEQKIEAPFQYVFSKLAELTNWINKIVDLDGLFQRVVLLNSLVRDVAAQWRILANSVPFGDAQSRTDAYHAATHAKHVDQAQQDVLDYMAGGGGIDAPVFDEAYASWLTYFQAASS